jgi:hypothetical protein
MVLGLVAAGLLFPSGAAAHNSRGWFWTEGYADRRLERFADIVDADCLGVGPWRWNGRRYKYNHFTCGLIHDDGTGIEVTVEVLGRTRARVLYNERVVVIR